MSVLFNVLIDQAAQGAIKPANLLSMLQAGQRYTYGQLWVMFRKERPGEYHVTSGKLGHDAEGTIVATSPVEAKLTVIDILVEASKSKAKQ